MKDKKRVPNAFEWLPKHKELGNFGFQMSDKTDDRKPLFRLVNDNDELFFVNDSDEILHFVVSEGGGQITCESDVGAISNKVLKYEKVLPDEAIKLDEFDSVLDCDFVLQADVTVSSEELGIINFTTFPEKGSVSGVILLWDTGEKGKEVMCLRQNGNATERLSFKREKSGVGNE
jgi:hypothetical protein